MNNKIIAGALFDFMGWLTSRPKRIMLSSADDASPAADAIKDFAKMRGLSLDDAQVQNWQEALAEQPAQQEPVTGCVCRWNSEGDRVVTCERHQGWLEVIAEWADRARDAEKKLKALNTSPPAQRTWVGLTDEEREALWYRFGYMELMRAIEAKLRSKNT